MSSGLGGILRFVTPDLHFSPKCECVAKLCGAQRGEGAHLAPTGHLATSAGLLLVVPPLGRRA